MATAHDPHLGEKYWPSSFEFELLPSSQKAIQEYRSFIWHRGLLIFVSFLGLMTSMQIDTSTGFIGAFTERQLSLLFIVACCLVYVIYHGLRQKNREQLVQNLRRARALERRRFVEVLKQYRVEGAEVTLEKKKNEEEEKIKDDLVYLVKVKFIDSCTCAYYRFNKYFPSFSSINWNKKDEVEKKNEEE